MHLYAQGHCIALGVSAYMVWVDSMFKIDLGKSAPCLVFDRLLQGHGKVDIMVGVDGGLSGMGLCPN